MWGFASLSVVFGRATDGLAVDCHPHQESTVSGLSRIVATSSAVLALVGATVASAPSVAQAKTFDIDGIIVCGQRDGKKCQWSDWNSGGPTITVETDSISGRTE